MDYEPTSPASRTTTSGPNRAGRPNRAGDIVARRAEHGVIGESATKSTCIFGKVPMRSSLPKRCMESLIATWIAEIVDRYDLLRFHNRAI